MLYAVSAALFLCLARAFRRGFTRRLSVVLGILIAVGFLTKLNFVGVAFGVYVGLVVLTVREARVNRREALWSLARAGGIGAAPVLLYALVNLLSHHSTFGLSPPRGLPMRFRRSCWSKRSATHGRCTCHACRECRTTSSE